MPSTGSSYRGRSRDGVERSRLSEDVKYVKKEELDDSYRSSGRRGYDSDDRHERYRSVKREEDEYRHTRRSRSPGTRGERVKREEREPGSRSRGYDESRVKREVSPRDNDRDDEAPQKPPAKPNLNQSGVLATESKRITTGDVLKYHDPLEAADPPKAPQFRLYIFSPDGQVLDTIKLNQKKHYLLGRDVKICDIPLDIRSASKQHAVIQYRQITSRDKYGETHKITKPYLIDLESSHGTKLNFEAVPTSRYIELHSKDVLQFGGDKMEYVFMSGL